MEFISGSEKKFYEFIADLTEKDKIAILTHNDIDGMVSAVIATKILGKVDYLAFLDYRQIKIRNCILEIKSKKINKLLVLDYSCEQELDSIKEIEKFAEILILDHHFSSQDINSKKIIFLRTETKIPASYLSYYLFSKIQAIPNWLPALGILSDRADKYVKENSEEVWKDFNLKGSLNLFEIMSILNNALIYFKSKSERIFRVLEKAKKPEEILELKKYSDEVEQEILEKLDEFKKKHEKIKDLLFYLYSSKFGINSELSTRISLKDVDKTILLARNSNGIISLSARRQDGKVNCVSLLKQLTQGIENSFTGGHLPAAGGNFSQKHLGKFKENLKKLQTSF
jgi:oligoribonuclease NrnB/cAMP/cGMP phosphodiesterase (DHH superfamily)